MNVFFSPEHGCWVYDCLYGCFGTDYEGHFEAFCAFLDHECKS